ncbi:DUF1254 domain-containing protein [Nocardia jinanensis]|uniref:DUF1254 domain-containing protein n=1 Tax=Nocardia jinanensis TaxID=382504 RepID=A0A917RGQ3_9NOCA|nr:DUF1254 domain-containing protein [Nocardia jinanensis]GGL06452.1 hypothetical protein GCM10011588_21190 [Nocardia jinanensis]
MREVPAVVGSDAAGQPMADRSRITRRSLLGLLAVTGLTACGGGEPESRIEPSGSPASRREVATDAYVFGYPMVLIDAIRNRALGSVPVNRFQHSSGIPDAGQRTVVRVDLDNLYSVAWLDLRKEPVLFAVPEIQDRRWVMQVIDAWSNTAHTPRNRQPQVPPDETPPYTYAVTGPGWSGTLPPGVVELPVTTSDAWLYGRIEVRGSADVPAVRAIQAQLRLAPLSAWNTRAATESGSIPDPGDWSESVGQGPVAQMSARAFFERLCELMVDNPPTPADEPAMRRFGTIGIRPGGLPEGVSTGELDAGVDAAKKKMAAYVDPGSVRRDGWVLDMGVGRYGTNYLLRASTAEQGLGANLPEAVVYPALFEQADDDGVPLEFTLRFPPGQAPPAETFWSLTAYGAEGYLVQNPAGIQTVGHTAAPEFAADGALEIAVQATDPGSRVPRSNWLPIPEQGQFSLILRVYDPEPRVLDGRWFPPPLVP